MADTYVATLVGTSQLIEGMTLPVARTAGTDCDLINLVYKNSAPFHPLRLYNIFHLYVNLSTIPTGVAPKNCICISPKAVE